MKQTNFFIVSIILILFAACGGSSQKDGNIINRKNIIGKWIATEVEIRNMPEHMKGQVDEEQLKQMIPTDMQQSMWLEFKDDNTYIMNVHSDSVMIGKWKLKNRRLELVYQQNKASLKIEKLSKNKMEINYSSLFLNQGYLMQKAFGNMKIIITFERADRPVRKNK